MEDASIDRSDEQVVGGRDGMDISRQMEIELLLYTHQYRHRPTDRPTGIIIDNESISI